MTTGRFAPSPSGPMHLGNLFCCLLAWLGVRQAGGRVVLRIEDLDTVRCPPRYARQVMEDLRWLGLDWDEGPLTGGPHGPYFQSERTALYRAALEALQARGLVYPCFCTRAELHAAADSVSASGASMEERRAASAPHRADGRFVYPGTCRRLTKQEAAARAKLRPPALRLRVPDEETAFTDRRMGEYRENLALTCGDFLLRRSDGLFAYQLAVVVDDAAMGITEVVRGADLLSSTPRQLLLYRLLGLPPPSFRHIPLLLAPDGRRLSKRDGDLGLDALRTRRAPEEILGQLAALAGFHPSGTPETAAALVREFDWERLPRKDIRLPPGFLSAK